MSSSYLALFLFASAQLPHQDFIDVEVEKYERREKLARTVLYAHHKKPDKNREKRPKNRSYMAIHKR